MDGAAPAMLALAPSARLRPFVSQLWYAHSVASPELSKVRSARERILPTGHMHLVFRLDGPALRLFRDGADQEGSRIAGPVLGGVRSACYIKESGAPVVSIGAQLLPGAAQLLFGVSAAELAGVHTPLSALWGDQADALLNRIADAGNPARQLALLDLALCEHLPQWHGLHPQVAQALAELEGGVRIDAMVARSSYSHRALNALFKEAAGVSPKRYARLLRFQQVLRRLHGDAGLALSELAFAAGYSDQAHMNREFREFSGLTPLQYRLHAGASPHSGSPNHVPIA